jgi:hypothetical protein
MTVTLRKAWKHAEMEEIEDVAAGLLGKEQEAQSIEDDNPPIQMVPVDLFL